MLVLDKEQIAHSIELIACQIINSLEDENADIAVVGIRNKGIYVGKRVCKLLSEKLGRRIECGSTDITLYRDDIHDPEKVLNVGTTDIPFDVNDKIIILVDDVIYTGRSCRAALDSVIEFGRPAAIRLATLIDRGQREFPIQPDYVGHHIEVRNNESIAVRLQERDGYDEVRVVQSEQSG